MSSIYRKSFIFDAVSYEEYMNGTCTRRGRCNTRIMAKVAAPDCILFLLQNDIPCNIKFNFGLPIFGIENGDVLADRVQYGRLPDSGTWSDPTDPVVCNIFNNMTCIRFAMLSPIRIVEFTGQFVDIRVL